MNIFGTVVSDSEESLQSKSGGKFGLNKGFITNIAFNPNGGKDNTPLNTFEVSVKVGDRDYRIKLFEITDSVYSGGNKIGPTHPDFEATKELEEKQQLATITHFIKALGVTEDAIRNAVVTAKPTNFSQWVATVCSLVGTKEQYSTKPVDVFLQWQYQISENQKQTFLELPKNMKGKYFIVPAQHGTWTEKTTEDGGLQLVNEQGVVHPIEKSPSYMKSNWAKQQKVGEQNGTPTSGAFTPPAQTAQTSTWTN